MKYNFFSVELIIDKDIQVVFLLCYIDRYINTFTIDLNWNRITVILIIKEYSEVLCNWPKFERHKCETNFCWRISFYFTGSLELNLGKEFFKGITFKCRHPSCSILAFKPRFLFSSSLLSKFIVFLCSIFITCIKFIRINLILNYAIILLQTIFLNLFGQFLLIYKRNSPAIICFNKYFSRKCTIILKFNLSQALLSKDYLPKVYFRSFSWVCKSYYCFFARAHERNIDWTSFWKKWKDSVDVLIELRSECNCNSCWKTCTHSPRWSVFNMKEVFYTIMNR